MVTAGTPSAIGMITITTTITTDSLAHKTRKNKKGAPI
jgi:hypothetical protein